VRLAVLVNPRSGGGRGARVAPGVVGMLREAGHDVVELRGSSVTEAAALLTREVTRPAADGVPVDAVVSVGGDGGIHVALGVLREHAPGVPLGILAAGSGNDLARSLDLPLRDPVTQTAHLLASLSRPARMLDLGRVRLLGPDGAVDETREPLWFLNVASAGVDAAVNARANAMRRPRGKSRYLLGLAAELVRFRGYAVRVVADGADLGDCGTIVAVGNSRSIGGGMLIAPAANLSDGLLDVVVARTVGRALLASVFPRVYSGSHVTHPIVRVVRARTVDVLPDPDVLGRAPAPRLHADGEELCELPARVDLLPRAIPVLA